MGWWISSSDRDAEQVVEEMYVCRYHYTRHTIQVRSGMRNRQYHLLGIVRVFVMRRSIINDLFMAISSTVPCFTVGRSVVPLLDSRLAREILNQIYLHKYYVLQGSLMAVLWLAGWLNERTNDLATRTCLLRYLYGKSTAVCQPGWQVARLMLNGGGMYGLWLLSPRREYGARSTTATTSPSTLEVVNKMSV